MKKLFVLISVCACLLGSFGCNAEKKPETGGNLTNDTRNVMPRTPDDLNNRDDMNPNDMTPDERGAMPRTNQPMTQTGARDAADDIAQSVSDLPEVNDAYVVVVGNVALIGVDMKENVESNATEGLKERIASIATKDPRIVNAVVESDPDTATRIRKIRDDMRAGKPISGSFDQIAEFFNRMKPTTD